MAQRYNDPLSTGCYEIDLKVFPPTSSVEVKPYRRSRPYGKFITITVQRFLRRKKLKEHLRGAQASF
jgi:hypothetical protein